MADQTTAEENAALQLPPINNVNEISLDSTDVFVTAHTPVTMDNHKNSAVECQCKMQIDETKFTEASTLVNLDIPLLPLSGECTDYVRIKELCSGGFGSVYLVKKLTDGQLYAFKFIPKIETRKSQKIAIIEECRALQLCSTNPFVVTFFGLAHSVSYYMLAFEYAPHGDLWTHVQQYGKMNETWGRFYIAEMVLGVQHIHQKRIVHRDLKLKNMVLDNSGHLKIIDFGLAKMLAPGRKLKDCIGTASHMAPEMFNLSVGYNHAVDIFALGVSAYCLLIGTKPFKPAPRNNSKQNEEVPNDNGKSKLSAPGQHEAMRNIRKIILEDEPIYPSYLTEEAKDLLSSLLRKNPEVRLGCPADAISGQSQLRSHPFFKNICWERVYKKNYEGPPSFCTPQQVSVSGNSSPKHKTKMTRSPSKPTSTKNDKM